MKTALAFILAALLGVGSAQAQVGPSTPAPSQIIFVPGTNFNDQSAVAGSAASFYYPNYYGNAGTGKANKFNRLQVGLEATASTDKLQTTPTWVNNFVGLMESSQIAVTSTLGAAGIAAAQRTSDFRTIYGSASGGTGTVVAVTINDDASSIACAFCSYVFQVPGNTTGISLSQFDMNNQSTMIAVTPHTKLISGATAGLDITAGAKGTVATPNNNSSVGLVIGAGNNNGGAGLPVFNIGQIFNYNALDTTVGAGGNGVAIEYYTGQSQRWTGAADAVLAELWGDSAGIAVNSVFRVNASSTPTIVASTGYMWATAGSGLAISGSGTSNDLSIYNSAATLVAGILHNTGTFFTQGLLITNAETIGNGVTVPAGGSTSSLLKFYTTGTGFGISISAGSGAPTTTQPQGSLYLRTDGSSTSTRLYVNTTGSNVWTPVTTGS